MTANRTRSATSFCAIGLAAAAIMGLGASAAAAAPAPAPAATAASTVAVASADYSQQGSLREVQRAYEIPTDVMHLSNKSPDDLRIVDQFGYEHLVVPPGHTRIVLDSPIEVDDRLYTTWHLENARTGARIGTITMHWMIEDRWVGQQVTWLDQSTGQTHRNTDEAWMPAGQNATLYSRFTPTGDNNHRDYTFVYRTP
ncbi:MAG: hypothetical protein RLZ55_379 [Actinomycetota bacterium]